MILIMILMLMILWILLISTYTGLNNIKKTHAFPKFLSMCVSFAVIFITHIQQFLPLRPNAYGFFAVLLWAKPAQFQNMHNVPFYAAICCVVLECILLLFCIWILIDKQTRQMSHTELITLLSCITFMSIILYFLFWLNMESIQEEELSKENPKVQTR